VSPAASIFLDCSKPPFFAAMELPYKVAEILRRRVVAASPRKIE
jgi:hypothetical protein